VPARGRTLRWHVVRRPFERLPMADLLFVLLIIGCFAVFALTLRGLERL
jgi:hypothetical protein